MNNGTASPESSSPWDPTNSEHFRAPQQSSAATGTKSTGPSALAATLPPRQASVDAYRGIVMFLMLAEVLHLMTLAEAYPTSQLAEWIRYHTTHVAWTGCSLHDMIQPSFTLLVGVSLPFSLASRRARGSSLAKMTRHAAMRSLILIVLGIFLRSLGKPSTNFFFVDTLTQIGLGYFLLFWIAQTRTTIQLSILSAILIGYWALFAAWPLPGEDFQWEAVGVPSDWPNLMTGFAAHWNKNANPAAYFDIWFMNLFPRETPFEYNSGGYCVLNFVPTLATMQLGVLAGQILRTESLPKHKFGLLLTVGIGMLALGWALGAFGICPVVKRIWTPSWVLFSGGMCWMTLGVLYAICDWARWRLWAHPLMIIGANSITAYVMSWTLEEPIERNLERHLGQAIFLVAGEAWQPILQGAAILLIMWLILLWLYRQRIFVRI